MNFKPQTEQEIIESKLWPKADYDFEIVDAFDKNSKKSGKPMIELKLRLSRAGSTRIISDYLLVETPEKLLHAATALGLLDKYKTGNLSGDDFRGKRGKLKLAIEKDKKHVYPDKNVVADYVCASQPVELKTGGLLSFK
jgi:hypothetical protein